MPIPLIWEPTSIPQRQRSIHSFIKNPPRERYQEHEYSSDDLGVLSGRVGSDEVEEGGDGG